MSRLVFDAISKAGGFGVPFIERVYLVSGIESPVYGQTDTVDGVQVNISVYFTATGRERLDSPSNILNLLADKKIYAACVYGTDENQKIVQDSSKIFDYLVTYDGALSNWVLTSNSSYNPDRHAPNPDARVIPLALNEESIYETGNLTIENLAGLINFSNVDMAELEDNGELNTIIDDEIKYFKFTTSITVPLAFAKDFNITTFEELMEIVSDDYKNMSVYVFSSFIDWEALSDDTREAYRNNINLSTKFSKTPAYLEVFKNGELVPNEQTGFVTTSTGEPISNENVILDLGNNYKVLSSNEIPNLLSLFSSAPSGSEGSSLRQQYDTLNTIVGGYDASTEYDLLLKLNEYRKLYPYKNETDQFGELYNLVKSTVTSLIDLTKISNTVRKTFSLVPMVMDARDDSALAEYDEPVVVQANIDGDTESGSTRFPKELITRYAYSSVQQSGESETFSWEDEDTICDNGFIFFDYERSLRNDTVFSNIFDIDKIQLYFGKQFINGTLALFNTTLNKQYVHNGVPVTIKTARTIETSHHHGKETTFGSYRSILYNGESSYDSINYNSVDVGMSGDKDYSYCTIRNIVPASGDRYNLGTRVKDLQVDSFTDDYRMMCFYFQDYYDVSAASDTITTVDGVDYTDQSYNFTIKFIDQSTKAIKSLKENLYEAIYGSETGIEAYYNYAVSSGNNNNYTGYFNDFFISGIEELFADDPNSAPWIKTPIIYNIHRDILLNTFNGDSDALLRDAANTTAKISPRSGTLDQLETYFEIVSEFYENFYGPSSSVVVETLGDFLSEFDTDGVREVEYYHEIQTLPDIIYAGETYAEYYDDIENTPAYPIEISGWSDSMTPGMSPSAYDTSTLYTRAELRSQLDAVQYIGNLLSFIDYLDTNPSGLSSTAVDGRLLLQKLLVPGGDIATYYANVIGEADLSGYYLYWWMFLTTEYPVYATLYPTAADLSSSDYGLNQRLEYMARRIFAAENYAGSEFGTSSQITDFYEFLSVGDSYKV